MRKRAGILGLALTAVAALLAILWSVLPVAAKPWASGPQAGARDTDAVALEKMGDEATRRAQEIALDAVLRQVYVDPRSEGRTFGFVDGAAIQDIVVVAPSSTAPPDEWQVTLPPDRSPLTGHVQPGLDLAALQTGPAAAGRGITKQWPGCTLRLLTLAGQRDDLTWYVFCNLDDGRVASGTVDGRTGVFTPSPAPPVYPPPTALPSR